MSDHLVLYVNHLVHPMAVKSMTLPTQLHSGPSLVVKSMNMAGPSISTSPTQGDDSKSKHGEGEGEGGSEDKPLIQDAKCHFCQEEDNINNLEIPCACSNNMKVEAM